MRNFSGMSGDTGTEMFTPGSYVVQEIILYPRSAKVENKRIERLDIKDIVLEFRINESMYSPIMEVLISIEDGISLLDEYKIFGDEFIDLVLIKNPKDESADTEKLTVNLRIAEIINYVKRKPGAQFYQFKCVREHVYNNNKLLIRPFSGTIGNLLKKIITSDLKAEFGEIDISSRNIVKGIYPSLKPLDSALWLIRNAYEDETPIYLFETLNNGLNILSHKSMVDSDSYDTYNNFPILANRSLGTKEQYNEQRRKILKVSTETYTGKLFDVSVGAYSSTLHTLDITNKEFKVYGYKYRHRNKLNSNAPFSVNSEILNKKYDVTYTNKNYYVSLNSGNENNYHEPNNISILEGQSHYENINFITHEIVIYGDLDISVGRKIEVLFGNGSESEEIIDKLNSGFYIITNITHTFDSEYKQTITIKKDSW
jgi:hypothetical protein